MRRFFLFLLFLFSPLYAATELVFWHAFEGFLADKFAEIVEDFNYQSSTYKVILVNKGNYTEVYDRGVEAFEKGNPPHMLQVYEVATQTMMQKPEMYIPVDGLMRHYFKKFDPDVYIDTVKEFYSTADNRMLSLPWNASTGILFYNKQAFEIAGLNPENPPKTWEELEQAGIKLVKAGYTGFVTAWPAAYHLEFVCAGTTYLLLRKKMAFRGWMRDSTSMGFIKFAISKSCYNGKSKGSLVTKVALSINLKSVLPMGNLQSFCKVPTDFPC